MSFNRRILPADASTTGIVPEDHFHIDTWTGASGSENDIVGTNFAPDFVWIKNRGSGSYGHVLYDSTRGAEKELLTSSTNAQSNESSGLQHFGGGGYVIGNDSTVWSYNDNFVGYSWHANGGKTSSNTDGTITSTVQANQAGGFSIVKYTGNGSANATIGHGLATAPNMIISKNIESTGDWMVFHSSLSSNYAIKLHQTNAAFDTTQGTKGGGFSVSSTTMTVLSGVSNQENNNKNGDDFIAYCFADIEGLQKFGSYTGNASTSGPSINAGFEGRFLLIRRTDSGDNWMLFDTARHEAEDNNLALFPNSNSAESNPNLVNGIDFTATGFTINSSDSSINGNGATYIYWLIGKSSTSETPTVENSYSSENWIGSPRAISVYNGFQPGLVITRSFDDGSYNWGVYDSLRGHGSELHFDQTAAADVDLNNHGVGEFNTDNIALYGDDYPANYEEKKYIGYIFKADDETSTNSNGSISCTVSANAAAGFSMVTWTGTGSAGTLGHGLSSAPKFIIVKSATSTGEWLTWHTDYGGGDKYIYLNSNNNVASQSQFFNSTVPTSTVFSIGSHSDINANGQTIVAYCFADVTGHQKLGTYTGSGSLQTITTGFTPDMVLIKKLGSGENWAMFNSYSLGGRVHYPNQQSAGEAFNNRTMFSQSNGFQVPSSSGMTNGSGGTYIYMAVKKNVTQDDTAENNFNVINYQGSDEDDHFIGGMGFKPDLTVLKLRDSSDDWHWYDSVRGAGAQLDSASTGTESLQYAKRFDGFFSDGFRVNSSDNEINSDSYDYISYSWRGGGTWLVNNDGSITSLANANKTAGFSVVKYHGNSASSATIGHGLSSAPQLIITKAINFAAGWPTQYNDGSTAFYGLRLNSTGANDTGNGNVFYANTAPTSSVYTVGGSDEVNDDYDYIAYCWHSVTGKRKIGSYTGNGSSNHSITGLGFRPDFLLLKNVNSGSTYWAIFDSVRGGALGIYPNHSQGESNETGVFASLDSDGFTVNANNTANQSGHTIIYMAEKIH